MSAVQAQHHYGTYGTGKANDTDTYLWRPVMRLLEGVPVGGRVLDAGCGNGTFTEQLHAKGYAACGVDLEPTGISHARARCPDVRFELASVYDDLQARFGQTFDAVVSLEVIEHLYDPRAFVRRVRESLAPGGLFVLSTPYHGYLKNLLLALSGKTDAHYTALWDGGHIKFWSRRTLTTLLEGQGFEVVNFLGAGRVPYLWKSMVLLATPQVSRPRRAAAPAR